MGARPFLIDRSMMRCQALARVAVRQRLVSAPAARPALVAARWASHDSVSINDVRKGMILKKDDEYWDVRDWQPAKQGRGSASYEVTYDDLLTGKTGKTFKFGSGIKVTSVTLDKQVCEVMYLQGEGADKTVVVADENFNEIELPLTRFHGEKATSFKEGETKVAIHTDD